MTASVIFYLSYDLSKWPFVAFKMDIVSTKKKCIVVTDVVMTLLVPAESGHNNFYDMTLSTE